MKTFRHQLLFAAVAGLGCLPLHAEQSAEPPATTVAGNDANMQDAMDRMLAAQVKNDKAAQEAAAPEGLGKRIDAVLQEAAKAKSAETPAAYYGTQWKLLRLLPEVACKTKEARAKIAAVSPAVKQFLADNDKLLDKLSAHYLRFRQELGLRSDKVDQAAQKMGFKGEVDAARGGVAADGDLAFPKDAAKSAVTAAEKEQIAALETALLKLLAADPRKRADNYADLWKAAADNLPSAWYFQVEFKADAKLGETYPETLKFLRSFNHGLGDLERYEAMATDLGWDLAQLDDAAGLTPATGGRPRPAGAPLPAGGTVSSDGTVTAGGAAAGGAGATEPGAADGNPGNPGTPAPDTGAVADWQKKLNSQLNKPEPGQAAAAAPDEKSDKLTDAAQHLADQIKELRQTAAKAKADNDAAAFFKSQWQLLRMLAQVAYQDAGQRKAIGADNDETKAFVRDNDETIGLLAKLYERFKQKLGLRSDQVDRMAKMMGRGRNGGTQTAPGGTQPAGNQGGDQGPLADINLDAPDDKNGGDGPDTITAQERYKIAALESYLARIAAYEKSKAIANADTDLKNAAKNLDGAYFFQVLYKKDPTLGAKYPNILKFLRSIAGGLGDLQDYEEQLRRAGFTVNEDGELVRDNGGGGGDNNQNQGDRPNPAWRPGGGAPRGGGGGGGRGGRGR